jgi:hypothetical protein
MELKALDNTWINDSVVELIVCGQKCNIYTDFLAKELIKEKNNRDQYALWEGIMKSNYKDWRVTIN